MVCFGRLGERPSMGAIWALPASNEYALSGVYKAEVPGRVRRPRQGRVPPLPRVCEGGARALGRRKRPMSLPPEGAGPSRTGARPIGRLPRRFRWSKKIPQPAALERSSPYQWLPSSLPRESRGGPCHGATSTSALRRTHPASVPGRDASHHRATCDR